VISNFTPIERPGYRVPLPAAGTWREILNSDATDYDGGGRGNLGSVEAVSGSDGVHAAVMLPPLATLWLEFEDGA